MAVVTFTAGTVILQEGAPINQVLIISSGSIHARSEKGELFLEKGDVPAIFDLYCGYSFYTYTAVDNVSCLVYSLENQTVADVIRGSAGLGELFAASMCRQCCNIFDNFIMQEYHCDTFYHYLKDSYQEYSSLCRKYDVTPKQLGGIDELMPFHSQEDLPAYLSGYYEAAHNLEPAVKKALFHARPDFTDGFLQKAADDVHRVFEHIELLTAYQADSAYLLLNTGGIDLFDLYTSLCVEVARMQEDTMSLNAAISKLMIQMESQHAIDKALCKQRAAQYREELDTAAAAAEQPVDSKADTLLEELTDSAKCILNYVEYAEDSSKRFLSDLKGYINTSDRSSQEDEVHTLRKRLTVAFYEIYTTAFQLSMSDKNVPLPVRMFLLFGYMDEALAGKENTKALAKLAKQNLSDPSRQVYTLYDWLKEIYEGRKAPSRNEFDSDYLQYLHEMRYAGKIDAATETRMADDAAQKVLFELQNMFPSVNKVTCGRVTTFCPLFSEHNCLRSPESMLVTADALHNALDQVRKVDFKAYYRETVFTMQEAGINRELVQCEILPDIILMPNIGVKSILWQEIEGRRRNTPSRVMFPLLCQEDIPTLITRVTGEFRWEMCKRMQGARWNDVSEPSLTSEYFDYVQFYRKNIELSPDAKEKIKLALQRARNNYREMFVRDYIQWVMYESTGSPRLNKVSRRILLRYCPFSAEIRNKVGANPLFKEMLERYRILNTQDRRHLDNVFVKIRNSGKDIPEELLAQQRFLEM
ncbi:MAG: cyclic nucleotide-binding domain-containing protein [bacterium]|nr:cyclic nucleotide-binding domain-containing protein [bacterium]